MYLWNLFEVRDVRLTGNKPFDFGADPDLTNFTISAWKWQYCQFLVSK